MGCSRDTAFPSGANVTRSVSPCPTRSASYKRELVHPVGGHDRCRFRAARQTWWPVGTVVGARCTHLVPPFAMKARTVSTRYRGSRPSQTSGAGMVPAERPRSKKRLDTPRMRATSAGVSRGWIGGSLGRGDIRRATSCCRISVVGCREPLLGVEHQERRRGAFSPVSYQGMSR
jgi:hypothetical protein